MSNQASSIMDAYRTHGAALRRFVFRFTRCPDDVDDILQEAFIRAYVVELTRPIDQPKSFLFRIAKHLALSHVERSRLWSWAEFDEDTQQEYSSEAQVIAEDSVSHALEELTPQQQRVYRLRRFDGLSQEETAAHLGIAVSTAEKHMIMANGSVRRIAA